MVDILTSEQRSLLMSKVQEKNTKPEWILRSALHRLGFRYVLNNRNLSGKPDLSLPKYRTVIFVHGCFWHRHHNCKKASLPKDNREFWKKKLNDNVRRDKRNVISLEQEGWDVIIVWECDLYKKPIETVEKVVNLLEKNLNHRVLSKGHKYLDKKDLLRSAEKKVRKRIDGFKK